MSQAAAGTLVELAVLMDQAQKDSSGIILDTLGQPLPDLKVLAAPAAPTAATGAAGAVTAATRYYKIDEQLKDMRRTAASDATASIALAAEKGALTVIPTPTDARVMWTNIYASDDGTKYGRIGTIDHYRATGESTTGTGLEDLTFSGTYTGVGRDGIFEVEIDGTGTPDTMRWRKNGGAWTSLVALTGAPQSLSDGISVASAATTGHTLTSAGGRAWTFGAATTKFSDNVPTPDYSFRPLATSEVGTNQGFRSFSPNSVTAYPDQKSGESTELNANVGMARSFPTLKEFDFSKELAMRPGVSAFCAIHQLGEPDSITAIDGTRVFKYVTNPTTARPKPRSFTSLLWEGSPSIRPEILPASLIENRVYTFAATDAGEGFLVKLATTIKGSRHTLVGFGTEGTAGAYADSYAPIIVGVLRADITSIAVNVTTGPSAGTFKIKCAVNGNGYGSTETTCYYDTAAGNIQTVGGSQSSPYVELFDEAGLALGADSGENREPVMIYFPGPCSTLSLNDDWAWTADGILIPGAGSSPYSGTVIPREREWRIAAPHFRLLRAAQGQTPATVVKVISGSLTIENPLEAVRELNPECKTPISYDRLGLVRWKMALEGRYYSRYLQGLVNRDERIALQLNLLGEPIPNAPGSLSAYRRGTVWDVPQVAVRGTPKRPIKGRAVIMESFELEAEKSEVDGEDIFTETTYSDRLWLPPGMSLTNAAA